MITQWTISRYLTTLGSMLVGTKLEKFIEETQFFRGHKLGEVHTNTALFIGYTDTVYWRLNRV